MSIANFIKRSLKFLGLFLAFAILSLVLIGSTFEFLPHTKYYGQDYEKAFNKKDLGLLAIGNSKLLASLDNTTLQKELGLEPVNLGSIFSNLSVTRLTFESYLNNCEVMPKMVLMEVSWFTFNPVRTQFNEIGGDLFLNDYKLWPEALNYYPEIIDPLRKSFMRQVYSKVMPIGDIDYSSEFKDMSRFEKTYDFKLSEFEEVFPDHIAGVDPELLAEFERIVNLCKENNIQLVLYTAPEVSEYRSLQTDIEDIKTIFRNIPDVPYLDYSEGGEFFKKDYELWMKDSHHLNENVRYSEILAKDIKAKLDL
ncbi:MAG: hypothetical protein EX254_03500 [Flavobacteriaceae bacterium]|nr:hypothetical protein [Flavobacteriaceae bacterium]NNK27497.1 hypothetical protein [Flavobacteriaceae bacterium]RZV66787.1 MAG: hypothetical protein EX254_03500 [Flavobacteriaceae bacterium]